MYNLHAEAPNTHNIGDLTSLEKLDLRWNKLAFMAEELQQLEQRGCTVLT